MRTFDANWSLVNLSNTTSLSLSLPLSIYNRTNIHPSPPPFSPKPHQSFPFPARLQRTSIPSLQQQRENRTNTGQSAARAQHHSPRRVRRRRPRRRARRCACRASTRGGSLQRHRNAHGDGGLDDGRVAHGRTGGRHVGCCTA